MKIFLDVDGNLIDRVLFGRNSWLGTFYGSYNIGIYFFYLNCVSEQDAASVALADRGNTSWIGVMVPGCKI